MSSMDDITEVKPQFDEVECKLPDESTSWLARIHPYFKDLSHVLVLKLDLLLMTWAFIAG